MPEYVYALHDFIPENEDEVSFHAGERIEVVERDDLYGDGWWQGRNLAGKVGLFPVTYTTPAAPAAGSTTSLGNDDTQDSKPEPGDSRPGVDPNIIAPIPKAAPPQFLNGDHDFSEPRSAGEEVMKATLTDVQKAIEQLGRNHGDNDGDRSFSFASTKDDRDTDTDFDLSDIDGVDDANDTEAWHKGARMKLAEKARRAVEEAEKLEAMIGGLSSSDRRTAPPIEVELSDESDDELDHEEFTSRSGAFQGIPEEDEDVETEGDIPRSKGDIATTTTTTNTTTSHQTTSTATPQPSEDTSVSLSVPEKDETQLETATATRSSFPEIVSPPTIPAVDHSPAAQTSEAQPSTDPSSTWLPTASVQDDAKHESPAPSPIPEPTRTATPLRNLVSYTPPAASSTPIPKAAGSTAPLMHSKQSSVASSSSLKSPTPAPVFVPEPTRSLVTTPAPLLAPQSSTATTVFASSTITSSPPPLTVPSPATSTLVAGERKKDKHPSEWTLEDVLDWLRGKGFDQDVCDKFTEQEITGDVLLELDVNLLKTEIGIMAFGKRVRISNAIAELRRPPSITYSDHHELSPLGPHTPISPNSQVHSRTQSQSHSHHSFPGNGHAYSQSIQSSLGSPLGLPGTGINGYGNGNVHPGTGVPVHQGGFVVVGGPLTENPSQSVGGDYVNVPKPGEREGVGLGISNQGGLLKPRPTHLALSPSDGALKATAITDSLPVPVQEEPEDRGHMSDGDVVPASRMRRKLFGRSHDSANSSLRHSKDMSPMGSPITKDIPDKGDKEKEKEKDAGSTGSRHTKGKRSLDAGKGSERLSIFGGTFGGSLSKGRKPPPRVTAEDASSGQTEKSSSMFSLPRLHSGGARKSSSTHRSATPNDSPKKSPKEFKETSDSATKQEKTKTIKEKDGKDATLLRKRTTSSSNGNTSPPAAGNGSAVPGGIAKSGRNILEQIGEPDHVGWMRKKGDRYNSWKNRYFVLKGPHLYCLRSDSKSETKIKGYIHIIGYKVSVDENLDPGRYAFRIDHDQDKTHYFSSDEKMAVRDWMKAIMKATIDRDYTRPVVSSCNIPTIPLTVAQAMNPAPRPPSPTARAATQKALRRENPNQLSTRDAQILMGLPADNGKDGRARLDSFFTDQAVDAGMVNLDQDQDRDSSATPRMSKPAAPPRPSREMRGAAPTRSSTLVGHGEEALVEWANGHLPPALQIIDISGPLCSGLTLLRLAESIKGKPSSPPVPDSAFPTDVDDDKLDGLFRLFDFLLDNDVKMGSVSINDVRQGKRDKIVQLLKALKAWEEKRKAIVQSIGKGTAVQGGAFIGPTWA